MGKSIKMGKIHLKNVGKSSCYQKNNFLNTDRIPFTTKLRSFLFHLQPNCNSFLFHLQPNCNSFLFHLQPNCNSVLFYLQPNCNSVLFLLPLFLCEHITYKLSIQQPPLLLQPQPRSMHYLPVK